MSDNEQAIEILNFEDEKTFRYMGAILVCAALTKITDHFFYETWSLRFIPEVYFFVIFSSFILFNMAFYNVVRDYLKHIEHNKNLLLLLFGKIIMGILINLTALFVIESGKIIKANFLPDFAISLLSIFDFGRFALL
mgnify:CR=1 FL=1